MPLPFKMDLQARGELEIFVTRSFAAPPALVFEAHVRPELLKRWLSVHLPLVVCTVDLRPGGKFRYVWRAPDGKEMAMSGTFVEIEAPHRTVHTEAFDEDWTGGETRVTTLFLPDPVGTRLEMTILYRSAEGRDSALRSGMAEGMAEGYKVLDAMLRAPQSP